MAFEKEEDCGWEGHGVQVGMIEGHGAFEMEIMVGRVRVSKWGWSRAVGPLKRKKTLAGRVRMFK